MNINWDAEFQENTLTGLSAIGTGDENRLTFFKNSQYLNNHCTQTTLPCLIKLDIEKEKYIFNKHAKNQINPP